MEKQSKFEMGEILNIETEFDKDEKQLKHKILVCKDNKKYICEYKTYSDGVSNIITNYNYATKKGIPLMMLPPSFAESFIKQNLVADDNGNIIKIYEYKEPLTLEQIEDRLGYKIEIVKK